MFTFQAVAQASKFDFLSLEMSGSATVDRKDGATRFTEIVLRSRLALPKGAERQKCLPCDRLAFGALCLESEIVVESA
jgi:hypothetical protein